MEAYVICWRKFADFSGRARRKEFWTFTLINLLVVLILEGLVMLSITNNGSESGLSAASYGFLGLLTVFAFATLVPSIAVDVRRLHDTGRSGWWWFIQFVPLIGSIWLFVLFLLDSEPGANEWGPNPKAPASVATA